MPRNRGRQTNVYVPFGVLKYGYKMNQKRFASIGKTLGILDADGVGGVFFGGNSPKPPKATKDEPTGIISSFFDTAKSRALEKAGWTINAGGNKRGIRTSGRAITVCVDTPFGYKYAWNTTAAEVAETLALGATQPSASDNLVWGSFPKPPRAKIRTNAGTFSTFIPPNQASLDAAVGKGYTVTGLDPEWLASP